MTRESSSPVSSTRGMGTPSPADTVSPRRRLRRYVLGALAVALVLVAGYSFGYEPPYRGTLVERPPRPLIFAHRGFGDHGPDNSLYAVEHALRAGMDGVDVDGQLTRDGEVVIFHDLSVDRLTSGVGRVRDKTRDEMLTLDLGPKYDPTIRGAYVRTFEDFVRTVRGHGILMVELKVPGLAATGIERRAVDIIRRYDAYRDVVLSSFNPLVLYRVKRLDPRVRTAGAVVMGGLASAALWGAIFHAWFPAKTATPAGFLIWMLVALSILVVAARLLDLGLSIVAPRLAPTLVLILMAALFQAARTRNVGWSLIAVGFTV